MQYECGAAPTGRRQPADTDSVFSARETGTSDRDSDLRHTYDRICSGLCTGPAALAVCAGGAAAGTAGALCQALLYSGERCAEAVYLL